MRPFKFDKLSAVNAATVEQKNNTYLLCLYPYVLW